MTRRTLAAGILFLLASITEAKVASTTLESLTANSELILIGTVTEVERNGPWRVAHVAVGETLKGTASDNFSTWPRRRGPATSPRPHPARRYCSFFANPRQTQTSTPHHPRSCTRCPSSSLAGQVVATYQCASSTALPTSGSGPGMSTYQPRCPRSRIHVRLPTSFDSPSSSPFAMQ